MELPFQRGGFGGETVVFDIVAEGAEMPIIIEVKTNLDPKDLGQIAGYLAILEESGTNAGLLVGNSISSYRQFLTGRVGTLVRKLMDSENMGVVLVDNYSLVLFSNYAQLNLTEMPWIVHSEEPVGRIYGR